MNPKDTSRILDHVASDFIYDNTNLLPQIITKYKGNAVMRTLKTRPVLAILLVFFGLTIITGAAYAIGKFSGFLPGFGFVTDSSLVQVLDAPVEVSANGLVVQAVSAVNDETRFWVALALSHNPSPETFYNAEIVLPDGKLISSEQAGWQETDAGEVNILFEFPPLPGATTTVTLQFEYTLAQDEWNTMIIPLTLRALLPDEIIYEQPTNHESWQSEARDGVMLVLENVAAASDKTILQVSLRFEQPHTWLNSDWNVTLTDENGGLYPMTEITPDVTDGVIKLYETLPFAGDEALTLSLVAFPDAENLPMMVDFSATPTSFNFDPGANPQIGQHWVFDQILQVGKYHLHLTGATLVSHNSLVFEFEPVGNVTGVMLYSEQASGSSGGLPVDNNQFTAGLTFDQLPADAFVIQITSVFYTAHGKWQIAWLAPAAPDGIVVGPTNTPPPTPFAVATPTIISSDPLLLEVQALVQKFSQQFETGPGWIHTLAETLTTPSPGQTFPPAYITSEEWLEIDEDGYVIKSVHIDRDEYGNIIQQAATVDNYYINFTFGDAGYNDGQYYRFSVDTLTQELRQLPNYPDTVVTREEVTCDDGTPCLLFTFLDTFSAPITNPGEKQSFGGAGRRTWINQQTGLQTQTQSFWLLSDGSERIEYTERYLSIEQTATAPQDILDILARVIVP